MGTRVNHITTVKGQNNSSYDFITVVQVVPHIHCHVVVEVRVECQCGSAWFHPSAKWGRSILCSCTELKLMAAVSGLHSFLRWRLILTMDLTTHKPRQRYYFYWTLMGLKCEVGLMGEDHFQKWFNWWKKLSLQFNFTKILVLHPICVTIISI